MSFAVQRIGSAPDTAVERRIGSSPDTAVERRRLGAGHGRWAAAARLPSGRLGAMQIAILGAGGVGGLLAGALSRSGEDVVVIAREETAAHINAGGISVRSAHLGDF